MLLFVWLLIPITLSAENFHDRYEFWKDLQLSVGTMTGAHVGDLDGGFDGSVYRPGFRPGITFSLVKQVSYRSYVGISLRDMGLGGTNRSQHNAMSITGEPPPSVFRYSAHMQHIGFVWDHYFRRDENIQPVIHFMAGYSKAYSKYMIQGINPQSYMTQESSPAYLSAVYRAETDVKAYRPDVGVGSGVSVRLNNYLALGISTEFVITPSLVPGSVLSVADIRGQDTFMGYGTFGMLTLVLMVKSSTDGRFSYPIRNKVREQHLPFYQVR